MVTETPIREYADWKQIELLRRRKREGTLGKLQLTTPLWLRHNIAVELGYDVPEGEDFLLGPLPPVGRAVAGRIPQPTITAPLPAVTPVLPQLAPQLPQPTPAITLTGDYGLLYQDYLRTGGTLDVIGWGASGSPLRPGGEGEITDESLQKFLNDLVQAGQIGDVENILRTAQVSEEEIDQIVGVETRRQELTDLVAQTFPDYSLQEFVDWVETDPGTFWGKIRTGGRTESKVDLLRLIGVQQSDIDRFLPPAFPTASERQAILFGELGYNPAPPVKNIKERNERVQAFRAYRSAGGKLFADQWELYGMPATPADELPMLTIEQRQAVINNEVRKQDNLFKVLGEGLRHLPKQLAASILQAIQGQGGASVVNKDWADRFIADAKKDLDQFVADIEGRYGQSDLPLKLTDVAQLPGNIAFSLTSMGAGLAVGVPIALAPLPGARVAAWGLGSAASGAVAYSMTTYQVMQTYLEAKNEEMIAQTGRGLTQQEEDRLKEAFDDKARAYGLWEAVPEATSNLLFAKILLMPLTKVAGRAVATRIVGKLTGLYGEELLTETITQKGQSDLEVQVGLREGRISWVEAFKEVAPQTFLLTTILGGAGQVGVSSVQKIRASLKKEIGDSPIFQEINENVAENIFDEVEAEAKPTEVAPKAEAPVTEAKPPVALEPLVKEAVPEVTPAPEVTLYGSGVTVEGKYKTLQELGSTLGLKPEARVFELSITDPREYLKIANLPSDTVLWENLDILENVANVLRKKGYDAAFIKTELGSAAQRRAFGENRLLVWNTERIVTPQQAIPKAEDVAEKVGEVFQAQMMRERDIVRGLIEGLESVARGEVTYSEYKDFLLRMKGEIQQYRAWVESQPELEGFEVFEGEPGIEVAGFVPQGLNLEEIVTGLGAKDALDAGDLPMLRGMLANADSFIDTAALVRAGEMEFRSAKTGIVSPTEVTPTAPAVEITAEAAQTWTEAGIQPSMLPEEVAAIEIRPPAKGKITQISMDDQLKLQQAREAAEEAPAETQEAYQAQWEIEGLKAVHQVDPVANYRITETVTRKVKQPDGSYKLTQSTRQVGLDRFINIREQTFPEYFTVKEAQMLRPYQDWSYYTQKGTPQYNHIPRNNVLDTIAQELGYDYTGGIDDLVNRIDQIRKERRQIKSLQSEIAEPYSLPPPPPLTPPPTDIPLNTNPEPTNPTHGQRNIIGLRPIDAGLTKTEIAGNFLKGMINSIGRASGLGQLVEAEPIANAAMRERARVLVTVESQANLLGTKWAVNLQKVFKFDKKGRIPALVGVDPGIPRAPTIQDVAARLPNYRDSLSGEQLEVVEGLREAIAPYHQLLEEQGLEIGVRPDVMEGGFYLPRGSAALEGAEEPFKVSGRGRGVRKGFERPALFESMAQGIEAGYEYYDIRKVLTAHAYDAGIRSTNTYIANYFKTLNDETGRLIGETIKMRMLRQNPEIAAVVEEINKNLSTLKRNIGALTQRQMDVIEMWQNDHEFGDIDVLLDGLETMRGGAERLLLPELKTLYQQNLQALKELRPSYKVAMRRAQATPRDQGVIILPEMAGRTYPNEIANAVNVVLKTEGETIGRLSPILNVINAYNNLYRGVRATLDDSIVGIQGLLGMYGDPKAYAAAFKLHLGAWANDRVLGAWVKDFDASRKAAGRLTTGEMATHGLHFAGAEGTEFSLGVGTRIGELPGVKQANRAFSNFGDVIRTTWADHSVETELAKGRTLEQLRESGDLDRIMNIANAMTGWTTKKTFGSLGELVLFAPRFLQARLETVTKAALGLRPGATLDQRIARNAIIKMIVIGTLLTMAANAVQGEDTDFELLRKDKEGRWRRNAKFMRIKFGGQYYSLFGTWDSLLGVFVNIATGRPLQVVRSMASGLVSNAFDIITGRDYNYKATTDSPSHFAQWALSNIVPFAVSQAGRGAKQVWGGIIDGETSDVVEGAIVIGTEIFGYKSFPQEDWDANLKRLGLWLYDEDTLLSTENVRYTWRLFVNDTSDKLRFVPLESVVGSSDYPPQVQAVAKTLLMRDEYSAVPNWTLISINADKDKGATFIDFYDQWADRQKLVEAGDKASYTVKGELQPDGKRKDVTYKGEEAVSAYDKKFPDAKFGQMSQSEFVLLKEYWSLNSDKLKAEMVEKHPELKANKRKEKLKSNTVDNAYLALAGYEPLLTKAAYDGFKRLLKELDIPDTAIPVSEIWGEKVTTLPSDALVNANFERGDIVDEFGANSWEDKLHRAKNPELNKWLGLGAIDTPVASLELKTEKTYRDTWRKLEDKDDPDWVGNLDDKEKVDGLTARDRKIAELKATKIGDMTWIDIDRKIKAIEKGTDEAPTSEENVNLYVDRGKLIDQEGIGSGSAEVMLQRVDNPDFDAWLTDEAIWGDKALKPIDRSKIPIWRIDVQLAGLDKDSPEYALLKRQRDGHINGFSDMLNVYVDWYETPKAGYFDDWFLMENKDFYDRMVAKGLIKERDFSKVPDIKWRDEWETMPPKKQEAIIKGVPESYANLEAEGSPLDDYVAYYNIPPKPVDYPEGFPNFEDDWWMMEHPDFYKEVYLGILGNQRKDYRKVPTREVWAKYLHYDSLDFRADQDKYRLDNPDLDEWGVLYGIWTETMTEKRQRRSISETERIQAEIEERLARLKEAVGTR